MAATPAWKERLAAEKRTASEIARLKVHDLFSPSDKSSCDTSVSWVNFVRRDAWFTKKDYDAEGNLTTDLDKVEKFVYSLSKLESVSDGDVDEMLHKENAAQYALDVLDEAIRGRKDKRVEPMVVTLQSAASSATSSEEMVLTTQSVFTSVKYAARQGLAAVLQEALASGFYYNEEGRALEKTNTIYGSNEDGAAYVISDIVANQDFAYVAPFLQKNAMSGTWRAGMVKIASKKWEDNPNINATAKDNEQYVLKKLNAEDAKLQISASVMDWEVPNEAEWDPEDMEAILASEVYWHTEDLLFQNEAFINPRSKDGIFRNLRSESGRTKMIETINMKANFVESFYGVAVQSAKARRVDRKGKEEREYDRANK